MTVSRLPAAALLACACAALSASGVHASDYNSGGPVPRRYVGFGLYPGYFPGFFSNGFSMYGPPVPTYMPVPGVYGGGSDSRFYDFYPGYGLTMPLNGWSAKGCYFMWPPKPLPTGLPSMFHPAPKLITPAPCHGPLPIDGLPDGGGPADDLQKGPPLEQVEPAVATSAEAAGPAPVRIEIRVPTTDAVVQFGETATDQTGTVREFESPPIQPGRDYTYHIVARWQADGRDVFHGRTVTVRSGQRVIVDFTRPGELALDR